MPENLQATPYLVGSQPWVAGQPLLYPLRVLPVMQGTTLPHVVSFDVEVVITQTYTTAPTLVGNQACIGNVSINDGLREWFPQGGSLNVVRAFERLENGDGLLPETLLGGGSTNPKYIRRRIYWNPQNLLGQPSDGSYACAFLAAGAGKVSLTCGALLAMSGDTTAATGTVNLYANLVRYYDKLIFPAYYTRQMLAVATGQIFTQRALYAIMGLLNSTSFDAIAAGDFGSVTTDFGGYLPIQAVPAPTLNAAFQADMRKGQFSVQGEPQNATYDVAPRQTNLTTPTAIAAQALDLQPVAWVPAGTKLTKLSMYAPSTLTFSFTGANSGSQILLGRFEPLTPSERGQQLATALAQLPGRGIVPLSDGSPGFNLRLLDDGNPNEYSGPYRDFMPWQAKLNRIPG